MTDIAYLLLKAGRGGDGRVSFIRRKYQPKGGPDGGMGGDGGAIFLKLNTDLSSLSHLSGKTEVSAEPGQRGGPDQMRGRHGQPAVVELPAGTHVWQVTANTIAQKRLRFTGDLAQALPLSQIDRQQYELEYVGGPYPQRDPGDVLDTTTVLPLEREALTRPAVAGWELLGVIDAEHPELLVCQGGFGGRGNVSFKGSINRTPLQAEWGSAGEERLLVFELKLLADVGLVGLPNAGKSTLLSVLTNARPKVANYPFTTLEPLLGMFTAEGRELVIADIPGLIEGASEGKGLGHDFLRHVDHCRSLVLVLAPEDQHLEALYEQPAALAETLVEQQHLLNSELAAYEATLTDKQQIVVINKSDLLTADHRQEIKRALKTAKLPEPLFISAATKEGVDQLMRAILHE